MSVDRSAHALHLTTRDVRLARLAALGRLWGAVKFFHPFLAYKNIDWDAALIETIPRVNAARNRKEYVAALNHLLSFLNDKNTHAQIIHARKDTRRVPTRKISRKNLVRLVDDVLMIDATRIAQTLAQDNSAFKELDEKISAALLHTQAVVWDLRSVRQADGFAVFYLDIFAQRTLARLLNSKVTLGTARTRLHNGYAPQTGTTSGGYYSAFVTTTPQTIVGTSKTKPLPMAFVINAHSPIGSDILSGLQATPRVLVVQEGDDGREFGAGSFTLHLAEDVCVAMRTMELVNPNGSIGFQAEVIVPQGDTAEAALAAARTALKQKNFRKAKRAASRMTLCALQDDAYLEMEFPNAEYRALALFRFWNIIHYFFPYKHLLDTPWDDILPRYLVKFEANQDAVEYQQTLHELVSELQDSHGGVRGATRFAAKLGAYAPPLVLKYVEKQTVVAAVLDDAQDTQIGDVILAIDDEPVETRRAYLARFIAASTPQALARRVNRELLRGPQESWAQLVVRGAGGETRAVSVLRSLELNDPRFYQSLERTEPVVQVLPNGFGYVDLARLQIARVDEMFEAIKHTPATIFDMRGYPNNTVWAIAPRLTTQKNVTGALFTRPFLQAVSLEFEETTNASYSFTQTLPAAQEDTYRGQVVVLINEDAISHAEHSCLFFEAATDVVFVGTPTNGANGDVTTMVLSGNIAVTFTGHDVRHADGRQLQRRGIQPHLLVQPTLRGIIEGRDEILEAAVEYLQARVGK